ncbi:MAG: DNA primase [Lachnospiraceae bacterium]|nr:DNA primase [Lachnospiraceae bacterium]
MYYPDELVEEIRSRCDIVDTLSQFISLQKKGSNYVCCCPFHNEKTPSFHVSRNKQMYKCFGCGEGGNVFTFLQRYENMTFPEAVEYLAPIAGVTLPERDNSKEAKERAGKRAKIFELNKDAANYFYRVLWDENRGKLGMQYLKKRGLTEETIKHFALGFAPTDSREIVRYLKSKGYSDEEIIESGIANFSEKYGMSSPFWNRVMFPILDEQGKVLGFGGRVMGDGEPKYLNSPETVVFNKRQNLFGFVFAKKARKDRFILCEGYMDVISLHQAGFTEAVAALGTAFTGEQARLLKRYSGNIYLSFDSDGAGVKAAMRAIDMFRQREIMAKVINMKPYKDPDEFIKALGADEYEQRIANAEDGFFFQVKTKENEHNLNDYAEKTKFHHEIAEFLATMDDPLLRDNYLEAVARDKGINKEHLREAVAKEALELANRQQREELRSADGKKTSKEDHIRHTEQLLLTYLLEEDGLYAQIEQYLSDDDFTNELYKNVAAMFFRELKSGNKPNPAGIVSKFEDANEQSEVSALFTTRIEELTDKKDREKAFLDILIKVKQNSFEKWKAENGNDLSVLGEEINRKKALEELKKINIRL